MPRLRRSAAAIRRAAGPGIALWTLVGTGAIAQAQTAPTTPATTPPASSPVASSASSGQIEEVVVTASKRPENIQSVPMSVTAVSGGTLERENITTVADFSRFVPGLGTTSSNNNRNSSIIIRNVGTAGTNPGTDQDVGVFIDGVYVPVAGPVYSELVDISTLEVLRGPQGTLYGRNTPVGAINITTRAPDGKLDGMIDVQGGDFGKERFAGALGVPIASNLSGRFSAFYDKNDGYLTNIYDGNSAGGQEQYGGRARLRWTPDALTTVDFIGYYQQVASYGATGTQINPLGPGGIVFGYNPIPTSFATSPFVVKEQATNPTHPYVVPGKWQVDSEDISLDHTQLYGVSLQVSRELPFLHATLSDIAAYNVYYDESPNQATGYLPLAIGSNLQRDDIGSFSNELRVVSDADQLISYITGFYYYHSDTDYLAMGVGEAQANRVFPVTTGGGGLIPAGNSQRLVFGQRTDAVAGYGQITAHVTDAFRLQGGLRISDDIKSSTIVAALSNLNGGAVSPVYAAVMGGGGQQAGHLDETSATWMLGAQYDITRHVMAYVLAGTGFKDGGFNSRSAVIVPYQFNPETSDTYEIGVKSTFWGNKIQLNVDAFRTLLKDFQQSTLSTTSTGFVIGNAGNFRNQGFELDAQAAPIQQLSLRASASYIPSKITGGANQLACDTTYPYAGSAPPSTSGPYTDATHKFCNYNGLTQPYAPTWRWSLLARWEQPIPGTPFQWFVSADATYQSGEYQDTTLDPRSYQTGYTLYDATAGIQRDAKWRLNFWIKNISDKRYDTAAAAQIAGAYVSGGGTAAANGFVGFLGQRRTFGGDLSYRF